MTSVQPLDPRRDPLLGDVPEVEGFKVLHPCVLFATLGRGGMGTVFQARHLNLEIDVAVKVLHPSLALHDEQFVERFKQEARAAAKLNDPNVVRVYDVCEAGPLHYLIMEFVQGETARARVRRKGQLSVEEAVEIGGVRHGRVTFAVGKNLSKAAPPRKPPRDRHATPRRPQTRAGCYA